MFHLFIPCLNPKIAICREMVFMNAYFSQSFSYPAIQCGLKSITLWVHLTLHQRVSFLIPWVCQTLWCVFIFMSRFGLRLIHGDCCVLPFPDHTIFKQIFFFMFTVQLGRQSTLESLAIFYLLLNYL